MSDTDASDVDLSVLVFFFSWTDSWIIHSFSLFLSCYLSQDVLWVNPVLRVHPLLEWDRMAPLLTALFLDRLLLKLPRHIFMVRKIERERDMKKTWKKRRESRSHREKKIRREMCSKKKRGKTFIGRQVQGWDISSLSFIDHTLIPSFLLLFSVSLMLCHECVSDCLLSLFFRLLFSSLCFSFLVSSSVIFALTIFLHAFCSSCSWTGKFFVVASSGGASFPGYGGSDPSPSPPSSTQAGTSSLTSSCQQSSCLDYSMYSPYSQGTGYYSQNAMYPYLSSSSAAAVSAVTNGFNGSSSLNNPSSSASSSPTYQSVQGVGKGSFHLILFLLHPLNYTNNP